jgi:hypothetical protein
LGLGAGGFGLAVVGDFFDHAAGVDSDFDAGGISYGYVQGADDQLGALQLEGATHKAVDDFHECDLDGFFVLYHGDGVDARAGRYGDAADQALVEVAELLSAESWGAATDSADFDVGAGADIWMNRHGYTSIYFFDMTGLKALLVWS